MIFILGLVILFIMVTGLQRLNILNVNISNKGIEKIVDKNNELSKFILTKVGEDLVKMRCEIVANKLKLLLSKKKKPYNYKEICNDPQIRKIVTQKIYVPLDNNKIPAGTIDLSDINGLAIIHPDKLIEGKNYSIWSDEYPEMWKLIKRSFTEDAVSGYYTFIDKGNHPVRKYMSLHRIKGTPFIVSAFVEIKHYFTPLINDVKRISESNKIDVEKKMYFYSNETLIEAEMKLFLLLLVIIILSILIAVWQARRLSNPIQNLSERVKQIGGGDFSITLPENGSEEITELSDAFNNLGHELTTYMENLKEEVSARQAMESEIAITRTIQESLLPHTFPPFPEMKEFDLHASLIAAKEVSGDFYDFFFVEENLLAIIIADVSGKGLPASLFMAVSRTLIRNLCLNSDKYSPSIILKKANDYLCQDNDECMFVTTFLAFYNIKSGVLKYGNAGHCEAIIYNQEKGNAKVSKKEDGVKLFGSFPDLPLGVLSNYEYREDKYTLGINESLILYTDGIIEATNSEDELYGIDNFRKQIYKMKAESDLKTTIDGINKSLDIFQGDKQFDDITLLMLRRN